jgi:hypothetical protein
MSSGHEEGGEEQRLGEEPPAPTRSSAPAGLREEEIIHIVQAEVKAGVEQIMAEMAGKFETMERVMTMLTAEAAEQRERRAAEEGELLRRKEREEEEAKKAVTGTSSSAARGSRPLAGGGGTPTPNSAGLARLLRSLDLGYEEEDEEEDAASSAGGDEGGEDVDAKDSSRSKKKKGGSREEIRAFLQNGGASVPTTFGKLDDAELALKAAASSDSTSFSLDKAMVKGAQRGRFGYEENGVVVEHLASISSEKMCIASGSLEHDEVVLAHAEGGKDVIMKTKDSKAPTSLVESGYDLSDRIKALITILKALYPGNIQAQQALRKLLVEVNACNMYYGNRMEVVLARHIGSEINHMLREWYNAILYSVDAILRLKGGMKKGIMPTTPLGTSPATAPVTSSGEEGEGIEVLPGIRTPTLSFKRLIETISDNASRRMLIMVLKSSTAPSSSKPNNNKGSGGGGGGGGGDGSPGGGQVKSGPVREQQKKGGGGGGAAGGKGGGAGGVALMHLFKDPSNNRNYCFDWLNGRCTADPCRFVHDEEMSEQTKAFLRKAHKLLQAAK